MSTIDDVAYRTIDGITLLARLYRPDTDGPITVSYTHLRAHET